MKFRRSLLLEIRPQSTRDFMNKMFLLIISSLLLVLTSKAEIWGPDELQIACPNSDSINLQLARKQYDYYFPANEPKLELQIGSQILEGSSDEIKYFKEIIDFLPNSEWLSDIRDCKTIFCGVDLILKNREAAYRALVIQRRDGYTVTSSKYNSKLFTAGEIRNIDKVLQTLPDSYKRLPTLKHIIRTAVIEDVSNLGRPNAGSASKDGKHIILYDGAFSYSYEFSLNTIAHEISHHYDYSFGISDSKEYIRLDPNLTNAVNEYGNRNFKENFAVSTAEYIYNSEKLKKIDFEKYEFIKRNVFNNKEYRRHSHPIIEKWIDNNGGITKLVTACLKSTIERAKEKDSTVYFETSGEDYIFL